MKAIPTVSRYMTTCPITIGIEQSVATAQHLLKEHQIRHLPALRGGTLDGVITERDIAMIERIEGVDPHKLRVEDAMTSDVYAVSPETRLDEIAEAMAARKYGSAIVVDNHKVVGIFTTVDLARALNELLHGRLA